MVKKRLSKSSLLWFIRSRSYVSVADIRRRFNIGGEHGDEVSAIDGPTGRAFVGLPPQQAKFLQDLWQEGKVGLELAADVKARSVTGVYGVYQRGEQPATPAAEADDAEDEVAQPG